MTMLEILQIALYLCLLLICTPLLGSFMARVYSGQRVWLTPVLAPVERLIYRAGGVAENTEMNWKGYAAALLAFNLLGFAALLLLQLVQGWLPLNPVGLSSVEPLLAEECASPASDESDRSDPSDR